MLKQVPYNTGKVLIGSRHYDTYRAPQMDAEAERLQRALLNAPRVDREGILIVVLSALITVVFGALLGVSK